MSKLYRITLEEQSFQIRFKKKEEFTLFVDKLVQFVVNDFFAKTFRKNRDERWVYKKKRKLTKQLIIFLSKEQEHLDPVLLKIGKLINKLLKKRDKELLLNYYLILGEKLIMFLKTYYYSSERDILSCKVKILYGYSFLLIQEKQMNEDSSTILDEINGGSLSNSYREEVTVKSIVEDFNDSNRIIFDVAEYSQENIQQQNSIGVEEFFQEFEVDLEVITDLEEIETEFFSFLCIANNFSEGFINSTQKIIYKYADFLKTLSKEFQVIHDNLISLANTMLNTDYSKLEDNFEFIKEYFESVFDDLRKWRVELFIEKSCEDIHFIDNSFQASVEQLNILLIDNEFSQSIDLVDEEGSLEFF